MVTQEFIKEQESYLKGLYRKKDSKLTTEDIQDLVQDTFEKITLYEDYYIHDFDKSNRIPEDKRVRSWLKLVCVQVYDRYKRGLLQIDEIAQDYSKDDLLESHNDYYYNNNKEEVDKLVNMLPNKQRDIVYLKLILGYTYDEISSKLNTTVTAATTMFSRGLTNLKKLVNSDDPEHETMQEVRMLKPYGDRPYAGEWNWRYGESAEQRNSRWYVYTNEELVAFCTSRQLNYNIKERIQ